MLLHAYNLRTQKIENRGQESPAHLHTKSGKSNTGQKAGRGEGRQRKLKEPKEREAGMGGLGSVDTALIPPGALC